MKPAQHSIRPSALSPPSSTPPPSSDRASGSARAFRIPEIKALRELRFALARGGLPASDKRTPEDSARIAAFRALEELLRLLDHYRRRVEQGDRCRLVEREHPREPGRLVIEMVIEVSP